MQSITLYKFAFSLPKEHVESFTSFIEPFVSSLSCFEKEENPSQWTIEGLIEGENLFDIEEKVRSFFEEKEIDFPLIHISKVIPKDWVRETYKAFPPISIGSFYIYGSHITNIPKNVIALHIDAATAFGSGEHPTTKGCLLLLERIYQNKLLSNSTAILDMGCGSGILAFAAAKLFHTSVIAADSDPESIKVCKENALLNTINSFVHCYVSQGFDAKEVKEQGPYDLILANILADPLKALSLPLYNSLKLGGYAILSGLLIEQKPSVLKVYSDCGFQQKDSIEEKGWCSLLIQKIR